MVAKDSGTPARQTSVAVAVSFGEDSNKYGRRLSGFENLEDDALTLAVSLGLGVVVCLVVIVSLIVEIKKIYKKFKYRVKRCFSVERIIMLLIYLIEIQIIRFYV